MDRSGAYDFNSRRRRRDDEKRRRVGTAVEGLVRSNGLAPVITQALSEGIYRLYKDLVAQKSFDKQDREYRKSQHRAEQKLAVRTANASGTNISVSAYVAHVREFAAHMIRLESLERRNLGRGRAIEQASKVTWDDLSPQERRRALQYISVNVLPGDKTRQPAREVEFLRSVASLIEQTTGHRIRFSSNAPGSQPADRPRHHGVEFDVMTAAAEMVDFPLSNEAMARRIQRIRRR
jgi:hypothetical protein